MAKNTQLIRSRMKSIQSTMKITNAMQLMATSKLKKQREMMDANRDYAYYLRETMQNILSNVDNIENVYLTERKEGRPITIFFSSDIGLCGGYNVNLQRFLLDNLTTDDPVIVIGKKSYQWLIKKGFNVINEVISSDEITFVQLRKLVDQAIELYLNNEVSCIQVIYSRFVNSIRFEPELVALLPVEEEEVSNKNIETLFEPDANSILNDLIPMYLRSLVYSYSLESKTSEQASRRLAMETATDNAEELIDELLLEYNRARQAAITQEISEIVAGADAL